MRLLLWLSGEHPPLPRAEALAGFEAEKHPLRILEEPPRLLVAETGADAATALRILARLGMTHDASEALFDSAAGLTALKQAAKSCALPAQVGFAVRAERCRPGGPSRTAVERDVGAALAGGRKVQLSEPDVVVRAFIDGERVYVGRQLWDRDPKESAARHVKHRPVGSPVSLPPKTARALLNLALVPAGGTVYDPFCGTGGILLEGAAMGLRVLGSDLDPEMVEASRKNLAHFRQVGLDLFAADIGDAGRVLQERGAPPIDAVVSDLPYGRSASSGKEPIPKLYDRAFESIRGLVRPGGRVVLGLPNQASAERAQSMLGAGDVFKVWVHRSLTRHFVVVPVWDPHVP